MIMHKNKLIILLIILLTLIFMPHSVLAQPCQGGINGTGGTFGAGGVTPGGAGGNGGDGVCGSSNSGGGGGGGGGAGGAGGSGGSGAGGTVIIKNTSGSMTISGSVDVRGGGSSTTNGGTVKLFYTGTAPSTAGVSSGRTYTATATTQLSDTCIPSSVSDDSSIGVASWSSPTNSLSQDGLKASASSSTTSNQISHYLKMTGCNLSIPSNSTITGVRVDFYRDWQDSGFGTAVSDNAVRLVTANTIQTTDRSGQSWGGAGAANWGTYGGATDLWGSTLTPSSVNASNFGVAIAASIPAQNTWGTDTAEIDSTHITVYYTINNNNAPSAPTLIYPGSGANDVGTAGNFQLRSTDAENDYLKYKIIVYNSDCSTNPQTFDMTADLADWINLDANSNSAYLGSSVISGSSIALFDGAALTSGAVYCWKAAAIDPGGSGTFGAYSATQLFTVSNTPSVPVLLSPASGATNVSTSPLFQLRSSDAENDYLRYRVQIYNSDCATAPQDFIQGATSSPWLFQDANNNTAYVGSSTLSGSTIAKFSGANLSPNTTYCWKASAIDPAGSASYSAFSATQLFTTGAANSGGVNIRGGGNVTGGSIVR